MSVMWALDDFTEENGATQTCQPWLRPVENMPLAIPPEKAEEKYGIVQIDSMSNQAIKGYGQKQDMDKVRH